MTPSEIRRQIRNRRQALSHQKQNLHSQQVLDVLIETLFQEDEFQTPLKIALFLSQDGELGTHPTIDYLWQQSRHQLYLPVLETLPDWHMGFATYTPQSQMKANRFGINEPDLLPEQHIAGEELNIVFMPLVAFDGNGHRLGMGGGFYDRSFAFKLKRPTAKPKLIGWAHSCQSVAKLPNEPWDVPLDGIVTENGFRYF
ncbi:MULTISPECIES: 5-formyltetrahydrofolate cyclo-ligase [Thiomicrorhabdus]|uniref:5-formyltetrahydrofolate cyclo-ligase n=1 Tax=Thiomicrorhabdus heinhorstiae TaxID=2748010 RepID=A0ABS0BWU5_9GAMM|nr:MULTISPECIES: 5-formyltetrahydrofolate cyclo-ligase [Thiomicrorhabdus]MBF6058278.1 5-formyltetrahydrofolate cyclo-ligase [Thiomicrorhabdus heinhorstiae]